MLAAQRWGDAWVVVAGLRVAELARARFLGGDPAGHAVRVLIGAGDAGRVAEAARGWLAAWGARILEGADPASLVVDGWGGAPDAALRAEVTAAEAPVLAVFAPAGLGQDGWPASATAVVELPAGMLADPDLADAVGEVWWMDLGTGAPEEAREAARAGLVRLR